MIQKFIATALVCLTLSVAASPPIHGLHNYMKSQYVPDFKDTDVFDKYVQGSIEGYLTAKELHHLLNMTVNEFSHVVRRVPVGKTHLNQSIPGFLLAAGLSEDNWEAEAMERPAILINGGHHGRELSSITQCLYYMMHMLFDHTEGVSNIENILETSAIFIIPIVNVDAYEAMSHHYIITDGEWKEARKNRHAYVSQRECPVQDVGVDLNRNYGYKWANDDHGSTGKEDVCAGDYRGPEAFSEPET